MIAYDGTEFHGWQRQADVRTVQQVLEEAIERLTESRARVTASGRTDTGVHAIGQVVAFYTQVTLGPDVIKRALNAFMPADVRVFHADEVPQSFHPTLDAVSKRYRYVIDNASVADPFQRRFALHVPHRLDHERMAEAGRALVGRHDFRSFETEWPNRTSSVRTIVDLTVERLGERVHVEVEADGFLYNMVRSITGTLLLVGSGRRPISFAGDTLLAQDRRQAGPTAPAHGLVLLRVNY